MPKQFLWQIEIEDTSLWVNFFQDVIGSSVVEIRMQGHLGLPV